MSTMSADASADASADTQAGAAEASEIDRLRRLVGPNEQSYADLRDEVRAAELAVRDAEAALGEVRAQLTEARIALRRAQQDQYHVLGLLARPKRLLNAIVRSASPR